VPARRDAACIAPANWAKTAVIERKRTGEAAMTILDDVRQVIAKTLKIPVETLTADTKLEEIGAQSLDVIEIVFELEEKYDISISFQGGDSARMRAQGDKVESSELEFRTIGEVANAVKRLVDAKAT
jgi:acyl carrier protein